MKVLLVSGGNSNEHEVSLRSGKAVADSIKALGHTLIQADPADNTFDITAATKNVDVVFLALHGQGGEDGELQKQLEFLGVPFTGSDSVASSLCFDKWQYKRFLRKSGLPMTEGRMVSVSHLDEGIFDTPYVLKPQKGGSSIDIQIVRTPSKKTRKMTMQLLKSHTEMLLETLVEGTEITVGIFDTEALPVIEIIPPKDMEFDYTNKYNGATQELCPPVHISKKVQEEAKRLALQIHRLTGCEHMSRTDMMVDNNGKLHVIETNTIPGLTKQSLLPKMVITAGYTMPEFIDKLLNLAISRQ